jgi:hypothetical protein
MILFFSPFSYAAAVFQEKRDQTPFFSYANATTTVLPYTSLFLKPILSSSKSFNPVPLHPAFSKLFIQQTGPLAHPSSAHKLFAEREYDQKVIYSYDIMFRSCRAAIKSLQETKNIIKHFNGLHQWSRRKRQDRSEKKRKAKHSKAQLCFYAIRR